MKMRTVAIVALACGLSALNLPAQNDSGDAGGPPPGGEFRGPPGGPPPPGPMLLVLDTNQDGTLDAAEIANASAALLTLDQDGDGKLTLEELRPPPPSGTNDSQFRTPPRGRHMVPPLFKALDVNRDGVLDAAEIANASAALLKLDTNGDGVLTRDELCPRPPQGGGRRGGPPPADDAGGPGETGDSPQPPSQ